METVDATQLVEELGISYFRDLSTFGALSDEAVRAMLERGTIQRLEDRKSVV